MATTGERNTQFRAGMIFAHALATATVINKGAMVVLNAGGYAKAGLTDASVVSVGIAQETVDNTDGADGERSVEAKTGTHLLANATAGDAITRVDVGNDCYILDDETVAKTDGGATRSVAGRVRAVEGSNVWVTL